MQRGGERWGIEFLGSEEGFSNRGLVNGEEIGPGEDNMAAIKRPSCTLCAFTYLLSYLLTYLLTYSMVQSPS